MVYCLVLISMTTFFGTMPVLFGKVVFCYHFFIQEPHKNPYLQRNPDFPNVFSQKLCVIIHIVQIERFHRELFV
jgi:hypothetical protein